MPTVPKFAEVIEQAPDGVVIVDSAGLIVYANTRMTDLFGFAPVDLTGRPIEALIPERFQQKHVQHRGSYSQQPRVRPMGAAHRSFLGRRQDGSEFPVEIHLAPFEDEDRHWTLAFIRDATEIQSIYDELKRSRQTAEDVARVKGEFLSLAAHDLSQPVQTLELVCSAIERNATPSSEFAELAEVASTSLVRMRELLKMLLDISRVESGSIRIDEQPVRIADICDDLERRFGSVAHAKNLKFRTSACPRIVVTDPTLLRGMLSNLVSNAIRYTSHGEIFLECAISAEGDVRLAVRDTGIGIAPEHVHAIFEDFYRGPDAKLATQDGFGLGLGIVRRLSKLLGFPVTVHSALGQGSIFTVQIPPHKVFSIPEDIAPK